MVVPGRPTVLYVEGAEGRGRYLAQALGAAEYEVDVRGPRSIPSRVEELQRYDFFILSDVPAEGVSLSQQEAIERYVRDFGGGFLMSGGDRSFGLGGWQGTRLERMLPVRMDSERRRDQPSLGLALVIDKSGSMNGPKMELAKEAAKATAELLGSDDYIEVIGFDSAPQAIVRMQSARNRVRILTRYRTASGTGRNEYFSGAGSGLPRPCGDPGAGQARDPPHRWAIAGGRNRGADAGDASRRHYRVDGWPSVRMSIGDSCRIWPTWAEGERT